MVRRRWHPRHWQQLRVQFGLKLKSQVEETPAQSLLSIFSDGPSQVPGAGSGIVDITKNLHYDLGEYLISFTDYTTG